MTDTAKLRELLAKEEPTSWDYDEVWDQAVALLDEVERLRDAVDSGLLEPRRLVAENARLRERNASLEECIGENAENARAREARLREALRDMIDLGDGLFKCADFERREAVRKKPIDFVSLEEWPDGLTGDDVADATREIEKLRARIAELERLGDAMADQAKNHGGQCAIQCASSGCPREAWRKARGGT
jgi:hypothetical protein